MATVLPRPTIQQEGFIVTDESLRTSFFPRYEHRPLSPGRVIRLLKLATLTPPVNIADPSAALQYTLIEHTLDSTDPISGHFSVKNSPYVTVSYCWGSSPPDTALIIQDRGESKALPITATAWEAVKRVLSAMHLAGKMLWVDQICIDQTNLEEKNAQVKLMAEIYRRCCHCMIWLGPMNVQTKSAFALLKQVEAAYPSSKPFSIMKENVAGMSQVQIRRLLVSRYGEDRLPLATDAGWIELAKLLQRDWFFRTWTFQEAVLSYKGDASFVCGTIHVPFINFYRAAMCLGTDVGHVGNIDTSKGRASLNQIINQRYSAQENHVMPLIWLLSNNWLRGCFDPRDRIYAYLGLRKEDGPDWEVEVDYTMPIRDLYIKVTSKIISIQESLTICMDAPGRHPVPPPGKEIADLPTWVPDWTRAPLTKAPQLFNPSAAHFSASLRRSHIPRLLDSSILVVAGRKVNYIADMLDVELPDELTERNPGPVLTGKILPCLYNTLRAAKQGVSDSKIMHMVVKTVTVGGYMRTDNSTHLKLDDEAWSENTCAFMLANILAPGSAPANQRPAVDPLLWLEALIQQSTHCIHRRFAILDDGLLALVPMAALKGHNIFILHGSSLPFVLEDAKKGCYRNMGICYVDGMMYGERVDWEENKADKIHIL